jgi:hypothetical protein
MRPLFYFFIISTFILYSCNSKNSKISTGNKKSIVGKWHRFSIKNGYSEFDIDSQYVVFFNQKTGRYRLAYKIENDSFKYLTLTYAAKITINGDSIFLKGNDGTTATLFRFNEPNIPFNNIPEEKDSLSFDSYRKGFDERTILEYEKAGIKFLDKKEEENDTIQMFQRLLKSKKQ